MVKQPCISRPSPKKNSTESRRSVPGDFNSKLQSLSLSVAIGWSAISRPSTKYNSKIKELCVFWDLNNNHAVPYPVTSLSGQPFQEHLLSIILPTQRAVPRDLNNCHAVSSPSVTTKWSAISRPSPKNNSTHLQVLCPGRPQQASSQSVSAKWPAISRPTQLRSLTTCFG